MQVLIGTTNEAKRIMFTQVLAGYPVTFVTLRDLGISAEPEEMGETPAENAAIKAAFYGQYADYVVCNDAGLYFDGIALNDVRQPGLHIRTPDGKRLNDEEMIDYYSRLVHSLGGKVLAYYLDGFAVKTPKGIHTFSRPQTEAIEKAFWMIDRPCQERCVGWPLDSLSLLLDGTPYLQRSVEPKPSAGRAPRKSWVHFIAGALGLSEQEEA